MIGAKLGRRVSASCLNLILTLATLSALLHTAGASIKATRLVMAASEAKDFRWPNKQLNVLIDQKTLNSSEQLVLASIFDQLEHKTCLQVKRLPPGQVNPFEPVKGGLNFVYIFKSQVGSSSRQPSMGLSSFGCVKQGRQSLVLTELAFKWPELVLRYHVLRSLAVEQVERPDGHVRRLLNMLPLSQKITSEDYSSSLAPPADSTDKTSGAFEYPAYFAYATSPLPSAGASQQTLPLARQASYLSDQDLAKVKQLYECQDYQNRLSPKPLNELASDATAPKLSDLLNKGAANATDSPTDDKLYSAELHSKSHFRAPVEEAKRAQDAQLEGAEESLRGLLSAIEESPTHTANESLIDEAARHIVDYLLAADEHQEAAGASNTTGRPETGAEGRPKAEGEARERAAADEFEQLNSLFKGESNKRSLEGRECRPLEVCPLKQPDGAPYDASGNSLRERPMLLKLDDFHALDPQLKQADQMKLSRLSNHSLASYQLMNHPASLADLWPSHKSDGGQPETKSEMLISFEQSPKAQDPVAALAGSQVLKLCSCQCQTMTPNSNTPDHATQGTWPPQTTTTPAPTQPPPAQTEPPTLPTLPTYPTFPTSWPVYPTVGPVIPTDDYDFTLPPLEPTSEQPAWPPVTMPPPWPTMSTDDDSPRTTTPAPTTTSTTTTTPPPPPPTTETITTTTTTTTTTTQKPQVSTESQMSSSSQMPLLSASACDQVEWVKPNKTVYGSARIVWDVDRGNQNYFLCNNQLDGELVPGKTHGFSCQISREGRAFEAHQFNVLTKPEHVNLAWVQRNSNSFGRTNFPVVGGYSKQRDPYIVSRCLVKDENNDVITLIGYINNHGAGWFPFDDIQIECGQYDVLACVN